MKLALCKECWTLFTIMDYYSNCRCWKSWGKKLQGTKTVQVSGPCKVYALRDADIRTGGGKYWIIKEPHPDIRRLKTRALSEVDAKRFRKKMYRKASGQPIRAKISKAKARSGSAAKSKELG